eukprot:m.189897 g.189897  ORF g.189897 m.189897 type:complete len:313 (-) comp25677_c0_seq7:2628-3566(-)
MIKLRSNELVPVFNYVRYNFNPHSTITIIADNYQRSNRTSDSVNKPSSFYSECILLLSINQRDPRHRLASHPPVSIAIRRPPLPSLPCLTLHNTTCPTTCFLVQRPPPPKLDVCVLPRLQSTPCMVLALVAGLLIHLGLPLASLRGQELEKMQLAPPAFLGTLRLLVFLKAAPRTIIARPPLLKTGKSHADSDLILLLPHHSNPIIINSRLHQPRSVRPPHLRPITNRSTPSKCTNRNHKHLPHPTRMTTSRHHNSLPHLQVKLILSTLRAKNFQFKKILDSNITRSVLQCLVSHPRRPRSSSQNSSSMELW